MYVHDNMHIVYISLKPTSAEPQNWLVRQYRNHLQTNCLHSYTPATTCTLHAIGIYRLHMEWVGGY